MTIKHLSFITLKVGPYTKRENFLVLDYMELEYIVLRIVQEKLFIIFAKEKCAKGKSFHLDGYEYGFT